MTTTHRLANLRRRLAEEGLDALVVSDGVNRRYLSGFTGSAGTLILSPQAASFAVDSRYYEQVGQQSPDFTLEKVGYDFVGNLARLLGAANARRVGFEARTLTVADFDTWRKATPDIEWVPTLGLVEELRAIKEPDELAAIAAAVRLTDECFSYVADIARPGMTEKQLGWEIEKFFRERGAQNWVAGPIVASGPNSALPHARPSERPLSLGEPITVDMGCLVDGYHSDLTRTFTLGHADARFEEIYSLVLKAHQTCEDGVRAGMVARAVDALARDVIDAAGYGEAFGHSLGHGVGLAIHEAPWARRTGEDTVSDGMTLTVEPGVYLPGWGGVRIEDTIVIREYGAEVLTRSPKRLQDMVIHV